jgi:hypothetical protein
VPLVAVGGAAFRRTFRDILPQIAPNCCRINAQRCGGLAQRHASVDKLLRFLVPRL